MACGRGGFSGLLRGRSALGGLGLQYQTYGSSVRHIFEGSFIEELTGAGKAIFEGGFNFEASDTRKNLYSTASEDQGAIGE